MTFERFLTEQRKLFVTLTSQLLLCLGFAVVVAKPSALEAYATLAEWSVYLAAFHGGANALAYFTQRKGGTGGAK